MTITSVFILVNILTSELCIRSRPESVSMNFGKEKHAYIRAHWQLGDSHASSRWLRVRNHLGVHLVHGGILRLLAKLYR